MLQRPPEPSLEDRATSLVLYARAQSVGFFERQAAMLATYLPAPDVVDACALVETGCDPHTAGLIVA